MLFLFPFKKEREEECFEGLLALNESQPYNDIYNDWQNSGRNIGYDPLYASSVIFLFYNYNSLDVTNVSKDSLSFFLYQKERAEEH